MGTRVISLLYCLLQETIVMEVPNSMIHLNLAHPGGPHLNHRKGTPVPHYSQGSKC